MSTPEPLRARRDEAGAASSRWAQIRRLAEAALPLPSDARAAFLATACGAVSALRAEVEAQVDACERAARGSFLAGSAAAHAAPLFTDVADHEPVEDAGSPEDETSPGRAEIEAALRDALAGRYAVERELTRGGTATVYVARDTRHGRRVALKVLEPALGAGMSTERFLREIRVTAGLTHPHILPLHDSGEAAGLLYYVMPYVDGETLRDQLARRGALPVDEAVRVLREVADALAYAHGRGVVHRDVKPANILVHGGHALVADFGIARAVRHAREAQDPNPPDEPPRPTHGAGTDTLTAVGTSPGTPAYMAPEQASGDTLDERADLYALGVVAYEMLAGAHPFGARTPREAIAAHLGEPPPPLAARRPDVPPALAALVEQLLAKNPADRPPSAEAVLHALQGIRAKPTTVTAGRRWGPLAAVALLVILATGGYAARRRAPAAANGPIGTSGTDAPPTALALHAVAVLPFENTSGDSQDDYFSDGLTDELASALARLPGLRVAGRTSSYAFKGKAVAAQEVGRALGVDAIVDGTVRRAGDRLRVTAQLVSTADGSVRWDSIFETSARDVFAVQDALKRAIAGALAPVLGGASAPGADGQNADVARGTTDQQAYELYLKGRYDFLLRNPTRLARAVRYFRQAVARDPGFARAHAGLAMAYSIWPIYLPGPLDSIAALTLSSAERAVALDSMLPDAQFALGKALELHLRFPEAVAHYRAGLARDPTSVTGHHWLGFALLSLGRTEEALAEFRRATHLDPLAHSAAASIALALLDLRRFPEARAAARDALAIDSTFAGSTWALALAQTFGGQPDSASRTLERGLRLHPGNVRLATALLLAYAAAGRWADAARVRGQLNAPGAHAADDVDVAEADLVFGDRQPLLRLLTSAAGQSRYLTSGLWFGCLPLLDPLRADARFRAAMRSLTVEQCSLARPWPIPLRTMDGLRRAP